MEHTDCSLVLGYPNQGSLGSHQFLLNVHFLDPSDNNVMKSQHHYNIK